MTSSFQQLPTAAALRGLAVALVLVASATGTRSPSDVSSSAPPQAPTEYEVKAAFLYNFATFVQWPEDAFESAAAPIVFAVVGKDPFGRVLDTTLAGKRVHQRPIEIRRFRHARDIGHCHVLFVPHSELDQTRHIVRQTGGAPVLLVGEHSGFAERGGVINFYIAENRVRFEINPVTARERELRVSSKLLRLARIVSAMGSA